MAFIGKYKLTGLLGKGGMGQVYKIEYPVTGKIGALKLLKPAAVMQSVMGREKIEALFIKEARTMARIRHPHILDVIDFGRADEGLYFTMDFFCNNLGRIIGEKDETEVPSRRIKIEKAVHYTVQTLEGLACMHWHGIIHRDIKPFNILVTELDSVKIGDFGLAAFTGEADGAGHDSIKVGSPYYAAPEQEADAGKADVHSDLYSVGVVLYRMVTGLLPDISGNRASDLNPDLDQEWDRFFEKAIHKNPARRFRNAGEMIPAVKALEAQWHTRKEKICSAPRSLLQSVTRPAGIRPRKTGIKQPAGTAARVFGLNDLMMPAAYIDNDFITRDNGCIHDRTTGLTWQQAGTQYPVTYAAAKDYIRGLNRQAAGGITDWRLPTIEELATLLIPPPENDGHCITDRFDATQTFLWSADTCTFTSAWYVNIEMGFAGHNDKGAFHYVRAVSG